MAHMPHDLCSSFTHSIRSRCTRRYQHGWYKGWRRNGRPNFKSALYLPRAWKMGHASKGPKTHSFDVINASRFYWLTSKWIFSLIQGIYINWGCLRDIGIKVLVDYSSVVHISLLIRSILTLLKLGLLGSYIIIISHCLCSSGLFYLVVMFFYSETM